jgi:hypothetical protein
MVNVVAPTWQPKLMAFLEHLKSTSFNRKKNIFTPKFFILLHSEKQNISKIYYLNPEANAIKLF